MLKSKTGFPMPAGTYIDHPTDNRINNRSCVMNSQKKRNRGYALALSLITGLALLACPMQHQELSLPGQGGPGGGTVGSEGAEYANGIHPKIPLAASITAFTITSPVTAAGTINHASRIISVTVPVGTAVTDMTASATHTGVSIDPDPGTARSYTEPVGYTVRGETGGSRSYAVRVDVGQSSAADILDLSINEVTGTFGDNGTDIHVVLP
jgi:hypothetical protein